MPKFMVTPKVPNSYKYLYKKTVNKVADPLIIQKCSKSSVCFNIWKVFWCLGPVGTRWNKTWCARHTSSTIHNGS